MFKLASRQRPEKFKATVENIISLCDQHNYFILVSADTDDKTMFNDDIRRYCGDRGIILVYGTSTGKNHAINRDVNTHPVPHWDILVNMSDDMKFQHKGFDVDIRNEFAEGLDWFVHFPDNNRKDICTLSIIGRDYYNRDKYIYNPAYITVCSDDEATEVAKNRHRYRFNPKVLVHHTHPGYGADWDPLYVRNEAQDIYDKDRETLKLRRWSGFE